jgi:hypothetical protein
MWLNGVLSAKLRTGSLARVVSRNGLLDWAPVESTVFAAEFCTHAATPENQNPYGVAQGLSRAVLMHNSLSAPAREIIGPRGNSARGTIG